MKLSTSRDTTSIIFLICSYCCSKWKADRHSVECVCCHSDGSLLLSAGRAIKLWNLDDYTMIKVGGAYCHDVPTPLVYMLNFHGPLSTCIITLQVFVRCDLSTCVLFCISEVHWSCYECEAAAIYW
jgi:WD40 repeat protein